MNKKLDDETLRRAFASLAEESEPSEECPGPDEIGAAVRAELPVDRRHEIVDHLATCPICAETWRAAHAVFGGPPPVPFTERVRRWLGEPLPYQAGLAAAAVLLLVVAVPGLRIDLFDPGGPAGGPTTAVAELRGEIQPAIAGGQALLREACRLSWTLDTDGEPEGVLYTLWIDAGDGLSRTVRGLEEPEYVIDASELKDIPAGESLFWRVEALLPGGERVSSETFETRLE